MSRRNRLFASLASGINAEGKLPGGVNAVTDVNQLPSNPSEGDFALVISTNKLYVYNGSAWFNIALVNQAPTAITGNQASYSLASDGTPTVITLISTDPEGFPLTWSATTSGDTQVGTVTQVDNVFTITPSTNEADVGELSVTFSVTDGNNSETTVSSFTLVFSTKFSDPANVSTTPYSVNTYVTRVNRIAFTGDDTLLVTSWQSGYVNKYDTSSGLSYISSTDFQNNLGTANIANLLVVGDHAFIGGWDTGLCVFNHNTMSVTYSETQSQAGSRSSVRTGYGYDLETMPLFITDKNIVPFRNYANPGSGWNGYRWSGSNSLTGGGSVGKIMSGSLSALDGCYGWMYDQEYDILLVSGGTGVRAFRVDGATGASTLLGGHNHPTGMYQYTYDPTTKTYFAAVYNSGQVFAATLNSNGSFTSRGYRSNTNNNGWPHLYCKDGFLYGAENGSQTIYVWSISNTAELTQVGSFANGHGINNNFLGTNEKNMQWNPTGESLWYNTNYTVQSTNNLIKATG